MEIVEKKSTKPKNETATQRQIEELMAMGIPLSKCVFKNTVLSIDMTPETAFYAPNVNGPNAKPYRTARMWMTPHGVLCFQTNKYMPAFYKLIPLAAVTDTIILL